MNPHAGRGLQDGGGGGDKWPGEAGFRAGRRAFPATRMRRLRTPAAMRELVAETRLEVSDLVAPLFVRDGIDSPAEIGSMPGYVQHTVDSAVAECKHLASLAVPAVIVFGVPASGRKDPEGTTAFDPEGITQRAIGAVREALGESLVVMADLCIDEYTDHGHCGVLDPSGTVDNDATLEIYAKVAVSQARSGAHVVAPSGMMDGQVRAVREALDAAGFAMTAILSYAAKYASALYGPFRDAVDVTIAPGARRGYQQDWRNAREALAEVALDVAEGADLVMVKPALAYLDVIDRVASRSAVPVGAYHVSGEYAMVKAAAEQGWIDGPAVMMEHLTAIKRAGARFVVTYAAREVAEFLAAGHPRG